MNKSIALIATSIITLSGAVNAAGSHSGLLDTTASTSSSTIWSTGELGFIQNPAGPTHGKPAAATSSSAVESSANTSKADVSAKTSPSTIWSFGEVGYVQNPHYSAAAKGQGFSVAMARSQAMALQANVKGVKDISITF